jgi:acyloxyacyl hydrolase
LVEEVIIQQKVPDINNWIETKLCAVFPSPLSTTCQYLISIYGAPIIAGIIHRENSDVICHALPFCLNSPECHLNPNTTSKMLSTASLKQSATYQAASSMAMSPSLAKTVGEQVKAALKTGVKAHRASQMKTDASSEKNVDTRKMAEAIEESQKLPISTFFDSPDFGYQHLPVLDIDRDHFSSGSLYRGSHWRGRDCRDLDSYIYPGRKQNPYGKADDYNCNGIHGVHPSGASWKDVVCANSGQRGVGVVGDSAGAHFSIPVEWVTPATISLSTYSNLFSVINDEFDIPQNSAYTAYADTQPGSLYPLRSVYKEVARRNQCNFRDYQNLAVNGGDSYNVQTYTLSLSRNKTLDHPMVMFLELLGNDVCGPWHNLDEATPPATFKLNIYKILTELDQRLPNGSHVVVLGLADGRILYDVLHDHPHPIGGGVTYANVYDFLNCVYCNPCWGWLNTNQTDRDATTAHANLLNQQYRQIMAETGGKFKNFDMHYYDLPTDEIMASWVAQGHQRSQLVEPVDGFHPNQYFLSILADWLVKHLDQDAPGLLGTVNPQNSLITSVFGNQGGY